MNLRCFNCLYFPAIVVIIIFYLCCLIPTSDVPEIEIELPFNIQIDKIVHFCMYFGLSIAAAFNYLRLNKGEVSILLLLLYSFLLPIIYGAVIEVIQYYFCEGRSGDIYDFIADLLGSLVALPFIFYYRSWLLSKGLND